MYRYLKVSFHSQVRRQQCARRRVSRPACGRRDPFDSGLLDRLSIRDSRIVPLRDWIRSIPHTAPSRGFETREDPSSQYRGVRRTVAPESSTGDGRSRSVATRTVIGAAVGWNGPAGDQSGFAGALVSVPGRRSPIGVVGGDGSPGSRSRSRIPREGDDRHVPGTGRPSEG